MDFVIREVNPYENDIWSDRNVNPEINCTHCKVIMTLLTGPALPIGEPGWCLFVCGYCQIYCTVNFYGEMLWAFPVSRQIWYRRSK